MKNKFHAGIWFVVTGAIYLCGSRLSAQTKSDLPNAPLKLLPPYDELPPTFWEQHGMSLMVAGIAVIVLAALGVWLVVRPRIKLVVPQEVLARQALETLRQQPETGAVLVRVSQVLRNYFIAAFQLAPGELTTAEFTRAVLTCKPVDAKLAANLTSFLRECDERKFSPASAPVPLQAANRAVRLVEQAEEHRALLREAAETQNQIPRA